MRELEEAIRDLLWSAWVELGIPGTVRRHDSVALDPEPLVVFTIRLAAGDPRLLGLVYDWCGCHGSWLSVSRIAGIARAAPEYVRNDFARFSSALATEGLHWRPRADPPLPLVRDRKAIALPLERPALVALRLRCLAGVSTRAEVLGCLLATGSVHADAARLTPGGVSRRSVERVLADLEAAGLVVRVGEERRRRYRLREAALVSRLLGSSDLTWVDWRRLLEFASVLREVALNPDPSAKLRRVQAVSAASALSTLAGWLPELGPIDVSGREDAFERLLSWGTTAVRRFAEGWAPHPTHL